MLYELVTLQRAFSADNLLGLVYKIVQDKYAPIPEHYSDDVRDVINVLLVKDYEKRPLISDMLMTPYVNKKMDEFIQNGGFIGDRKLHVRKFRSPTKKRAIENTDQLEETKVLDRAKIETEEDAQAETMTPKERMMKKKQKMADAKAKELNEHTRGAIDNYSYAKRRNDGELTGHPGGEVPAANHTTKQKKPTNDLKGNEQDYYNRTDKYDGIVINDAKKVKVANFLSDDPSSHGPLTPGYPQKVTKQVSAPVNLGDSSSSLGGSFAANDRAEDTMKSDSMGSFMANDRFDYSGVSNTKGPGDTFKLSETGMSAISEISAEDSQAKTIKPLQPMHKAVSYDDRKIVSTGRYDPEEYYYNYECYQSDEFESDDDKTPSRVNKIEAERDEQELT